MNFLKFVNFIGGENYGALHAQLLQGEEWERIRPIILRSLDWSIDSYESLTPLKGGLDITYYQVIGNWDDNPAVQIETFAGKESIVLAPLDKQPESESLQ